MVLQAKNSSFNSESSPLFTSKISGLGNYQNLSYKQFSTRNYFFRLAVCDLVVRLRCFTLGVFRHADKANIQVYVPKNLHRDFLHTNLLLLQRGEHPYRRALFGSFHSGIDSCVKIIREVCEMHEVSLVWRIREK